VEIPFDALKLAALIVVSIGTVSDLRSRKIPNRLTFPAALIGIVAQSVYFASWGYSGDYWLRALAGAINGMLGWFTGIFIMSITKIFLRKFGHGDTKLVGAVGAFLGPGMVLIVYLYYSLVFGLYSLVSLAWSVPWHDLWMAQEMRKAGAQAKTPDMSKFNEARKGLIPVAPFIALGTLCAVILQQPTMEFLGFN
jgi:prepilin peptidase CpaA